MTLVPLFGAIPGGPEMLVMLLMMLFMLIPLGLAIWVAIDARDRTDHPLAWGVATFIAGFSPFFIGAVAVATLYYVVRDELGSAAPPTFGESDMEENAQVLGEPLGGKEEEELEPEDKLQPEAEVGAEPEAAEEAEGKDEDFEFGDHPPEEAKAEGGTGESDESVEGSEGKESSEAGGNEGSEESGEEPAEESGEEPADLTADEDEGESQDGDEKAE